MSTPIEITEQDLFAEIGRLYIENKALRHVREADRSSADGDSAASTQPGQSARTDPPRKERTPLP